MDLVELMAMSVLILNTNIHSEKIPKHLKITKSSFIKTQKSILNDIVDQNFLSEIYERIAACQFESKIELQEKFFKRVHHPTLITENNDQLQSSVSVQDESVFKQGTVFVKYGRYG